MWHEQLLELEWRQNSVITFWDRWTRVRMSEKLHLKWRHISPIRLCTLLSLAGRRPLTSILRRSHHHKNTIHFPADNWDECSAPNKIVTANLSTVVGPIATSVLKLNILFEDTGNDASPKAVPEPSRRNPLFRASKLLSMFLQRRNDKDGITHLLLKMQCFISMLPACR